MSKLIRKFFICQCENTEHQLCFSYFDDDDELYCEIHLIKQSFFKRLINGIKYIFGYTSKYGNFDNFIFKKEDSSKLQEIVDFLNNKKDEDN